MAPLTSPDHPRVTRWLRTVALITFGLIVLGGFVRLTRILPLLAQVAEAQLDEFDPEYVTGVQGPRQIGCRVTVAGPGHAAVEFAEDQGVCADGREHGDGRAGIFQSLGIPERDPRRGAQSCEPRRFVNFDLVEDLHFLEGSAERRLVDRGIEDGLPTGQGRRGELLGGAGHEHAAISSMIGRKASGSLVVI